MAGRLPRPLSVAVIRTLRDDEAVPSSEPRRYPDAAGYVRLRWKVGVEEYVEVREHRLVAGRPRGRHVHHVNGNKADNSSGNLEHLTPAEHGIEHDLLMWRGDVRWRERRSRARRARREARWYAMRLAYESGMSTTEVGAVFGIDASNVLRGLRGRGVPMRWWLAGRRP